MNASVRLSHFYNAAAGRPLACTAYLKPNPFSPRDEGARLRSLVDGGDEHARTGGRSAGNPRRSPCPARNPAQPRSEHDRRGARCQVDAWTGLKVSGQRRCPWGGQFLSVMPSWVMVRFPQLMVLPDSAALGVVGGGDGVGGTVAGGGAGEDDLGACTLSGYPAGLRWTLSPTRLRPGVPVIWEQPTPVPVPRRPRSNS